MCDNIDCKDLVNSENKVKLKEEFGSDTVIWCKDCIARDKDMIEYNFFEEKIYEDETNKELEHINTICKIQLELIERTKHIIKDVVYPQFCESLCLNMEIIQEIAKNLIILNRI